VLLLRFIDLSTLSLRVQQGVCVTLMWLGPFKVSFQCFDMVAQYFEEILLGNQKSTLTELM